MRTLFLAVATIVAVSALGGGTMQARDYPFCRKAEAGPGDCKYDTYEQCLAAVSGINGYCQPNYWLSQPVSPPQVRRPSRGHRFYGPDY
jgi:hypothetical protein